MKSFKVKARTYFFLATLFFLGCDSLFEFSPNQSFDNDSPKALNSKSILALSKKGSGDTVTIVVASDTQRFYDDIDDFVAKVNSINAVDFAFINGDISDFGLLKEFEWVVGELAFLHVPYVAVVGNHDLVANGEEVYRRMFGPLDFSFSFGDIKFIVHNTNGREDTSGNVPDLVWLKEELYSDATAKYFITASHVPPFDGDFNEALEESYAKLLAEKEGFLVSLHGHVHTNYDGFPYGDGVRYISSAEFSDRSFVLLQIANGNIHSTIIHY